MEVEGGATSSLIWLVVRYCVGWKWFMVEIERLGQYFQT